MWPFIANADVSTIVEMAIETAVEEIGKVAKVQSQLKKAKTGHQESKKEVADLKEQLMTASNAWKKQKFDHEENEKKIKHLESVVSNNEVTIRRLEKEVRKCNVDYQS